MRAIEKPRPTRWVTLSALVFMAVVSGTRATQVLPVNLEEMTRHAATIFSGRCLESRIERDPVLGRSVTIAVFDVTRWIKGSADGTVTVKVLNPTDGNDIVPWFPRFRQGEEVVLFLYGESALGLTSPVGLGQGKFEVVRDKRGRKVALNEFGNRYLANGLSRQAAERLGPGVQQLRADEGVSPAALLDLAASLAGID